jgi:hypothetical protein
MLRVLLLVLYWVCHLFILFIVIIFTDSGDGVTHVIPVYESYSIPEQVKRFLFLFLFLLFLPFLKNVDWILLEEMLQNTLLNFFV